MSINSGEVSLNLRFRNLANGQKGFTLIELISTLVIISVLASVLIPRYVETERNSRLRAIDLGVSELNGRETLTWALVKLSDSGYINDQPQIWLTMDTNLGADYDWTTAPNSSGGTLRFKMETSAALVRSPSNRETPGRWRR
jgi:prepilin-type N-terminal cleavage/methylation domain-containing protein